MTKPEPTMYQLEKLVGMYKANIAELAAIRAIIAGGGRVPVHRVKLLRKKAKAVERYENELGVKTGEILSAEDREELHKLQAPLNAANDSKVAP
jgi:hypothetical protein